jgi:hypothetical protein
MNDEIDFRDPAFVARVQAWAADRRALDRAPSRLVDAVMDGVAAAPRRTPWFSRLPMRGAAGYAALTAAITVGVTFGILLAGRLTPDVGDASQSPAISTPSPTPEASSTAPIGTPAVLAGLTDVPIAAAAIGAFGDSVWVADRANRLSELDPVTGDVVRSVDLPRPVQNLLVTADSVWAASEQGNLVRVARLDLALTEVPAASGRALVEGQAVVWLGSVDAVVRIDVATNVVDTRITVPNRGPELGIAVDGAALWVATRTEIERIDPATGSVTAQILGDAGSLVLLDGTLWATRGTELLRIDPAAAVVLEFIPGLVSSGPIAAQTGALWVGGGSGPAIVQGWDLAAKRPGFLAEVPSAGSGLALTSDTIWVASVEADVVYRFRLP